MMQLLIPILSFLLLEIQFSVGELENHDFTQKDTAHDVYDMVDPNGESTVIRLVYPRHERPVLREITYYHVIEKPFTDEESNEEDLENSKTRIFTNSHSGMDFLPGPTVESFGDVVNETKEIEAKNKNIEENKHDQEKVTEAPGTTASVTDDNNKEVGNVTDLLIHENESEHKVKEPPIVRRKRNLDLKNVPEPPTLDLIETPAYTNQSPNDQNSTEELKKVMVIPKMSTKPNTYGMSIGRGASFIWNNLWTDKFNIYNTDNAIKPIEEPPINKYSEEVNETDLNIDVGGNNENEEGNNSVNTVVIDPCDGEEPNDQEYDGVDNTKDINSIGEENSGGEDSEKDLNNVSLDELVHNKQFWEWLTNWTEAYIQTVKEQMKDYIQKEISKQIKNITSELHQKLKEYPSLLDGNDYTEFINCEPDNCITKTQTIRGDKIINIFFIYPNQKRDDDEPEINEDVKTKNKIREDIKPESVEEFNKVFNDKIINLITNGKFVRNNTKINDVLRNPDINTSTDAEPNKRT